MADPSLGGDRRTFLKTVGASAAGAATLGGTGAALDAGSTGGYDHVVVVSDTHLGAPKANDGAFLEFFETDLQALAPDLLVLNGDVFELWTRGIASVLLQYNDLTTGLEALQAAGTDVVLTGGNHDWRTLAVGREDYEAATLDPPWDVTEEATFESGGRSFRAVHGHQGDPFQGLPQMELLCLGSDDFGKAIWEFYSLKDGWGSADDRVVAELDRVAVAAAGGSFQSVSLSHAFDDPIVVTSPASSNGPDPVHPRVRNVSSGSFEVTCEEWEYLDGSHATEDVAFAAFETGAHTLPDGTKVEVGRASTDEHWASVELTHAFDGPPAVLTQPQTANSGAIVDGSDAVVARHRNVSAGGFEVRLLEQEAFGDHVDEQVGYVAVETGTGTNDGAAFEAGVSAKAVTEDSYDLSFAGSYGSAPVVLADLQTFAGDDPAALRYESVSADGVTLFVEEERSADDEVTHVPERASHLAVDGPGQLLAAHSTSNTDWWDRITQDAVDAWSDVTAGLDVPAELVPVDPPMMAGLVEQGAASPGIVTSSLLAQYPDAFLVFGHTHSPGVGDRWVNSGAWTERGGEGLGGGEPPRNTFVEITAGEVAVKQWSPDGTTVLY